MNKKIYCCRNFQSNIVFRLFLENCSFFFHRILKSKMASFFGQCQNRIRLRTIYLIYDDKDDLRFFPERSVATSRTGSGPNRPTTSRRWSRKKKETSRLEFFNFNLTFLNNYSLPKSELDLSLGNAFRLTVSLNFELEKIDETDPFKF